MRLLPFLAALTLSACNCGVHTAQANGVLEVAPRALDFGVRPPGSRATLSLTLRNTGNGPLALRSVRLDSDARQAFSAGALPPALSSRSEATVEVAYQPPSEGPDGAVLVLEWDGGEERVSLSGRALTGAGDDAGLDAGATDAGSPDGGALDGGAVDGGADDAGAFDAGASTDAGLTDAGTDAGPGADAGSGWDGGNSTCPGVTSVRQVTLSAAGDVGFHRPVWNGSGWADAWYEQPSAGSPFSVYVERLDALGTALAGSRVPLATQGYFPHLVWNGAGYGLVYSHDVVVTPVQREIRFVRLDAQGVPVSGSDVPVSSTVPGQDNPAVAWNPLDAEYGVTWLSTSARQVMFQRRSSAGVAQGATVQLSGAASGYDHSAGTPLIFDGRFWAVTWTEGSSLMLARLDRSGAIASNAPVVAAAAATPSLAFNGSEYAFAFAATAPSYVATFARATATGAPIAGSVVTLGTAGRYSDWAAVAWTGSDWLVTWNEAAPATFGNTWTARIGPGGALVPGSRRQVSCGNNDGFPILGWSGSLAAVGYDDIAGTRSDRKLLLFP